MIGERVFGCQDRRTSSGVTRPRRTVRTSIAWTGAPRRSVGEPGLRIQRCWNRSTWGTRARTRDVNHADPGTARLDDVLARQRRLQPRLVHVPVHSLDRRAEGAKLVEECFGHEVAPVQDQIGSAQKPHALVRQRARAARQMRVRDDGNARHLGNLDLEGLLRR